MAITTTLMIISASTFSRKPNLIWKLEVPKSCINSNAPIRRSGNYQPSIWDYTHIQSLKNHYADEKFMRRRDELKTEVKIMLSDRNIKQLEQLEIIDNLQRLGLSYHFEDEICSILNNLYYDQISKRDHLYVKAQGFRLLRQYGFNISQEIFDGFFDMNTTGFSEIHYNEDTKGMLYLYEASFLAIEGEKELELARNLTEKHLRKYLADQNKKYMDQNLVELVHHALELPLHWRMLRLETKWFINYYKKRQDMMIPLLLELASLDFNIVQAAHIEDLKYLARWWKETRLAENLPFARDRLVENFFWTIGVNFLPQYGYFRRIVTKVNAFVTTIDDVYDVFGTLDELQIFTDAIQRWNIDQLDKLPEIMKMCYFALDNFINEVVADAPKEHGIFILPYLRNAWRDMCKSYLREAKWYYSQYIPTMEEYIENAWISVSAPVILVHAYFLVANTVNKEALHYLENNYHDIIRCSALIFRLANDLGTSSEELKRGDVPKAIQCYMNETKASEEEARQYIKILISQTWKKLNEAHELAAHPFPKIFVMCAMNLARMAQCMYQHGDGHGGVTINLILDDKIFVVLLHAFIFVTNPITKEQLESLNSYPDIIRWCAIINRLVDDLGTSSDELKRGDVSKPIQCYMNEKGVSEEEARKHIILQHFIDNDEQRPN